LRGKFDVIGDSKDQLDAGNAVRLDARFRGRVIPKDAVDARDAKTYWGTIGFEQQNDDEQENNESLEVNHWGRAGVSVLHHV
jgi:hypothetical protein